MKKRVKFDVGKIPWTGKEIRREIKRFSDMYKTKPFKNNIGGMWAPHMFACWFIIKKIQPKYIIESGVWKGQGTWLIEKAAPNAKIICLDPNLKKDRYISKNSVYYRKDFSMTDWKNISKDKTLVIFDDHQNAFERVKTAKKLGFKHLIFDDNCPPIIMKNSGFGDVYSIKKVLYSAGHFPDYSLKEAIKKVLWILYYTRSFKMLIRALKDFKKFEGKSGDKEYLLNLIEIYYEFPPIFKPNYHDKEFNKYFKRKPLLPDSLKEKFPEIYVEKDEYLGICYLKLK